MSSPQTFKVVYNGCHGGFDLSDCGLEEYNRRTSKNITLPDWKRMDLANFIERLLRDVKRKLKAKNYYK